MIKTLKNDELQRTDWLIDCSNQLTSLGKKKFILQNFWGIISYHVRTNKRYPLLNCRFLQPQQILDLSEAVELCQKSLNYNKKGFIGLSLSGAKSIDAIPTKILAKNLFNLHFGRFCQVRLNPFFSPCPPFLWFKKRREKVCCNKHLDKFGVCLLNPLV